MARPIKVIHMIGGGEYGGAENHIIQLLSSFPPGEVEGKVICFYRSSFAEVLREKGIEVIVMDQYHRFDPRIALGLRRILQREQPDILHTHGVRANFFGRIVARRLKTIKVVTTVHSVLHHDYNRWPIKLLTYAMEYSTRRLSDRFICVSQEIKQEVVDSGIPSSRVSVIPNGIDLNRFDSGRFDTDRRKARLKQELGLPADSFVIGTAARLRPVKGVHLLIEAAAELNKQSPDIYSNIHIVVIGDGPQRPELEELANRLGVSRHVHFPGFKENIIPYLTGFDCFANVSLSEGLPLAVLEAMACKIPVVASAVGAVPEVIEDGVDGILVEKGSIPSIVKGLSRIIANETLRKSLAEKAYEKVVNSYTTDVMSRKNLETYQELLED